MLNNKGPSKKIQNKDLQKEGQNKLYRVLIKLHT